MGNRCMKLSYHIVLVGALSPLLALGARPVQSFVDAIELEAGEAHEAQLVFRKRAKIRNEAEIDAMVHAGLPCSTAIHGSEDFIFGSCRCPAGKEISGDDPKCKVLKEEGSDGFLPDEASGCQCEESRDDDLAPMDKAMIVELLKKNGLEEMDHIKKLATLADNGANILQHAIVPALVDYAVNGEDYSKQITIDDIVKTLGNISYTTSSCLCGKLSTSATSVLPSFEAEMANLACRKATFTVEYQRALEFMRLVWSTCGKYARTCGDSRMMDDFVHASTKFIKSQLLCLRSQGDQGTTSMTSWFSSFEDFCKDNGHGAESTTTLLSKINNEFANDWNFSASILLPAMFESWELQQTRCFKTNFLATVNLKQEFLDKFLDLSASLSGYQIGPVVLPPLDLSRLLFDASKYSTDPLGEAVKYMNYPKSITPERTAAVNEAAEAYKLRFRDKIASRRALFTYVVAYSDPTPVLPLLKCREAFVNLLGDSDENVRCAATALIGRIMHFETNPNSDWFVNNHSQEFKDILQLALPYTNLTSKVLYLKGSSTDMVYGAARVTLEAAADEKKKAESAARAADDEKQKAESAARAADDEKKKAESAAHSAMEAEQSALKLKKIAEESKAAMEISEKAARQESDKAQVAKQLAQEEKKKVEVMAKNEVALAHENEERALREQELGNRERIARELDIYLSAQVWPLSVEAFSDSHDVKVLAPPGAMLLLSHSSASFQGRTLNLTNTSTTFDGLAVYRCPQPLACVGSRPWSKFSNGSQKMCMCTPGYNDTVPGCAACLPGFGRQPMDPFTCKPCSRYDVLPKLGFVCAPSLVVAFGMHSASKGKKSLTGSLLNIILSFGMSSNLVIMALSGTPAYQQLQEGTRQKFSMGASTVETFVTYSSSYDCVLGRALTSLYEWLQLSVTMPFLLLAACITLMLLASKAPAGTTWRLKLVRPFLVNSNTFLPTVLGAFVRFGSCVHLQHQGAAFRAYDLSRTCPPENLDAIMLAGVFGVSCIVGPLFWKMLIQMGEWWEPELQHYALGYITSSYKELYQWWESIVLMRKLALAYLAAYLPISYAAQSHMTLATAIMAVSLVGHAYCQPFKRQLLNVIEAASLAATSTAMSLARFAVASELNWSTKPEVALWAAMGSLVIIVLTTCLLLGIWVKEFFVPDAEEQGPATRRASVPLSIG